LWSFKQANSCAKSSFILVLLVVGIGLVVQVGRHEVVSGDAAQVYATAYSSIPQVSCTPTELEGGISRADLEEAEGGILRITSMVLGRRVHDYIVKAGIAREGIGPHLLRHTCATHMLEGGADIRFIQQLLGHEKLETTAIYTEVNIDQLQKVHARTHPAETAGHRPANGQ
jgi:hypothetical protein